MKMRRNKRKNKLSHIRQAGNKIELRQIKKEKKANNKRGEK